MIYIESITRPSKLKLDDEVTFILSNGDQYRGKVAKSCSYHISILTWDNDIIFRKLGINNHKFVQDIVGYGVYGSWPEVKTLKELETVLNALLKVNKPEKEVVKEEKEPDEWSWLLG